MKKLVFFFTLLVLSMSLFGQTIGTPPGPPISLDPNMTMVNIHVYGTVTATIGNIPVFPLPYVNVNITLWHKANSDDIDPEVIKSWNPFTNTSGYYMLNVWEPIPKYSLGFHWVEVEVNGQVEIVYLGQMPTQVDFHFD